MNEQKPPKGIEWTRIRTTVDGTPTTLRGYTWNPTGGCLHGCTWRMPDGSIAECYAKGIAERLAVNSYPHGFEHHYWRPEELNAPSKLKNPSGIFVGSMADLFGHWTPYNQIEQVIQVMRDNPQHIFQTLSKNPKRLPEFNIFPSNVWAGVSLPAGHMMSEQGGARALKSYIKTMQLIDAQVRFMSIEPLWFDVGEVFEAWINNGIELPFEWAIIGAASNGPKTYQPKRWWTQRLLDVLDDQNIPVFFKGNLKWHEHWSEFPQFEIVTQKQLSMF